MKDYKIYLYFFYDESIGEENVSHQTLTKSYGDSTENNSSCWLGSISSITLDRILKHCWWKEDVDIFVKENPECKGIHFTIWKENRNFGEKNWETYCPLQTIRDNIINELL